MRTFISILSRLIWPVLLTVVIFYASERRPTLPEGPLNFIGRDKWIHFFVFGLLAISFYRVHIIRNRPFINALLAISLASLYGLIDEVHQSFTPGRQMDVFDWIADTAGAIVAVSLYILLPHFRRLLEMDLCFSGKKKSARDNE